MNRYKIIHNSMLIIMFIVGSVATFGIMPFVLLCDFLIGVKKIEREDDSFNKG